MSLEDVRFDVHLENLSPGLEVRLVGQGKGAGNRDIRGVGRKGGVRLEGRGRGGRAGGR